MATNNRKNQTRNIKKFKKINTENKELEQVQHNAEQVLEGIINSAIIDGVLVKDVCLEPNISNEVHHNLGRKPLGWIVVRKRADSRIWDLQDTNPQPNRYLSIACSHSVQVDIWVF
jgi:hypothetical protein